VTPVVLEKHDLVVFMRTTSTNFLGPSLLLQILFF